MLGALTGTPPKTAVAITGCTINYVAVPIGRLLTLTVMHNNADGGTDADASDNRRQKWLSVF